MFAQMALKRENKKEYMVKIYSYIVQIAMK